MHEASWRRLHDWLDPRLAFSLRRRLGASLDPGFSLGLPRKMGIDPFQVRGQAGQRQRLAESLLPHLRLIDASILRRPRLKPGSRNARSLLAEAARLA